MVALAWIALLVAVTFGNRALGGVYSNDFTLPATPAQLGNQLLRAHRPSVGGVDGQIVFAVRSGSLDDHRGSIEQSIANVRKLPDVLAANAPLGPTTTSANGRTAYSSVHFSVNPQSLHHGYVAKVDRAVAPARQSGVSVDYGGQLGQAARPKSKSARSVVIGLVIALLVLLVGFGSVYAAGLPILSALLAAFTGVGIVGMLAASTSFATTAPTLAVMMGLGVGIDYALFLSTRHRQLVMDGVDPVDAATLSLATSGRAVLTAALTVVIALVSLYASGISFIGKLGLAAAITVAVAALGAFTIVPALLAWAGSRIDRLQVRRPVAERQAGDGAPGSHDAAERQVGERGLGGQRGWQRHAERLGAHPWRYLLSGLAVLVVLAIPLLSMHLGHDDAGSDPTSYTTKRAYDAVSTAFGVGANGPFTVVAQLGDRPTNATYRQSLGDSLRAALVATPDVAEVGPVRATPDGALLYATVIPSSAPQARATEQLMDTLQNRALPSVLAGAGATGYVSGSLAAALQFASGVANRLPIIIAVVIAAAFLLVLASFRSPVLALKAAVLNLFSIGAAFGVVVAAFQWGWADSLLGVSEKVPIESYVPMMMFAIVFGLSMDYEVFLLSRVREAWLRTGDNHRSVAVGLAATARVITCAALIMASVFLSFLGSNSVTIKMLALGLGVSVLIDASIIRLVVVPATMFLLGTYNWWVPAWLDRWLLKPL